MIASPNDNPQVIINNKIYSLHENLTKQIKIIKIKEAKILLKTKKEEKWLSLIN